MPYKEKEKRRDIYCLPVFHSGFQALLYTDITVSDRSNILFDQMENNMQSSSENNEDTLKLNDSISYNVLKSSKNKILLYTTLLTQMKGFTLQGHKTEENIKDI